MRVSKPAVGSAERSAVDSALARGYFSMGPEVAAFERELTAFLAGPPEFEVACVSSGTSALHLAAEGLGLGAGDEVLVPTLTYVATFQAVSATGAVPVACDVRYADGLLDLVDAERRITPRTKAIVYVHYASAAGDQNAVYAFAARHGLRVIEDAAHSFGGFCQGKRIGTAGDVTCFSFDGIKNITSGEGGAVVSRDAVVMERVRQARRLGLNADGEVSAQGWRYHMSDLMAAIGRAQLARFARELAPRRKALAARYSELFRGVSGVTPLVSGEGIVPHIYPVRLGANRDRVRTALTDERIETSVHYRPNHLLKFYRRDGLRLPIAEKLYAELLSLPLHPELEIADVERVAAVVLNCL